MVHIVKNEGFMSLLFSQASEVWPPKPPYGKDHKYDKVGKARGRWVQLRWVQLQW